MEQRYPCPEWVEAFLSAIDSELNRVMWNKHQTQYQSPFSNTGNTYSNNVFKVRAFDWGWFNAIIDWDEAGRKGPEPEEPVNFEWEDVKIYWYKWMGRGCEINQELAPERGIQMLNECLAAVRAEDTDD